MAEAIHRAVYQITPGGPAVSSDSSIRLGVLRQIFLAKLFQDRNIRNGCLPNNLTAHTAVAVGDKIPHSLDLPHWIRQAAAGLPTRPVR